MDNQIEEYPNTLTTRDIAYVPGKFHGKAIRGTSTSAGFTIASSDTSGLPTRTQLRDGASATYQGWFKNTSTTLTTSSSRAGSLMVIADSMTLSIHSNNTYKVGWISSNNEGVGDCYNDWVHVAVVFKDSISKIFVNGKKIIEGPISNSSGAYNSFRAIDSTQTLYVDEILISTEALYEEDFIPPTGPYGGKRILQTLTVESQPTKTDYLVGETFSLDGTVVKAVYSDGSQLDITSECVIVGDGVITDSTDFIELQYTYNGVTKNVFINIGRLSE